MEENLIRKDLVKGIISALSLGLIIASQKPSFWIHISWLWNKIYSMEFITLLVVIAALFQERIIRWWKKTELDMEITIAKPDCQMMQAYNLMTGQECLAFYIRIKVSHKSGPAGENVEIIPTEFCRIDGKNSSKITHFLPISLSWTHFPRGTNTTRVPIGSFRHCEFGHLVKDIRYTPPQSLLWLDTFIQPGSDVDGNFANAIASQGKFIFKLLLSGDNVGILRKSWEIEFGGWDDNESVMLKNVKIKEL